MQSFGAIVVSSQSPADYSNLEAPRELRVGRYQLSISFTINTGISRQSG